MSRYTKPILVAVLCCIFTTLFLHNTKSDFPLIFKKDLLAHDESSNSVVAANITRKFFPPMVRVNPLVKEQGNWMEGPYWQHIPPLFAYVPYVFFKLDGKVTIEVKRLSYAFLILLSGLLFIISIYLFSKDLWATAASALASIFWINTPFTHELVTGYAFGVSDIVLAFTVVCSFAAILWYLKSDRKDRKNYSPWKLAAIGLIICLPILAKNLLGAIPAATFFVLLFIDRKKIDRRFLAAACAFLSLILLYFLPLYLSSPQTFKNEILVSFYHLKQLEGWSRPWHWYLTNYLPQRYLFGWTWVYYLGLIFGSGLMIRDLRLQLLERKDKVLLWLSAGWFIWNLLAISLVQSKIPNFIFQSYLLSIFFIVYSLGLTISNVVRKRFSEPFDRKLLANFSLGMVSSILIIFILITCYEVVRFGQQFKVQRAQAYNYQSEHEKFYQLAENLKKDGINTSDLIIVNNPPNDCWERYYILFLTGAESKTLLEIYFLTVPHNSIAQNYRDIYFVDQSLVPKKINIPDLEQILKNNDKSIQSEIVRIKADKTSCQWLVPDAILNAQ